MKRSRDEDKSNTTPSPPHKNGSTKQTAELVLPISVVGTVNSEHKSKIIINPRHTKLVNVHNLPTPVSHRPCTPRYPISKQPLLNGGRKLRSRTSTAVAKSKQLQQQHQQQLHQAAVAAAAKAMVVSNPPRCPTPSSPSVSENKVNGGEDSDTGCSSLEDDDDFDGNFSSSTLFFVN